MLDVIGDLQSLIIKKLYTVLCRYSYKKGKYHEMPQRILVFTLPSVVKVSISTRRP